MKALSIKQPWAWLICIGVKDIENRDWKIGRRTHQCPLSDRDQKYFTIKVPERVYVHAGKVFDRAGYLSIFNNPRVDEFFKGDILDRWGGVHLDADFGAIIGEVDITGCVERSDSPWFVGKYGLVLANPVLYDKPVPYRGHEISMYDVGCVVRAIGELTKKMYEQEEQPEEAKP